MKFEANKPAAAARTLARDESAEANRLWEAVPYGVPAASACGTCQLDADVDTFSEDDEDEQSFTSGVGAASQLGSPKSILPERQMTTEVDNLCRHEERTERLSENVEVAINEGTSQPLMRSTSNAAAKAKQLIISMRAEAEKYARDKAQRRILQVKNSTASLGP